MDLMHVGPVLDGKQMTDAGGDVAEVMNPATGEVIAREACCSSEDVGRIVDSAERAFGSDAWGGLAPADRGVLLWKLADLLEARGVDVKYAIHPVAGRMPGHMNVPLAEANVPYTELYEIDDINPDIANVDVAVVVGANDVVNPAARDDPNSDIAGMPIVEVDRAHHCVVLKRSLNPGFAGIQNQLFFLPNTRMLFGSAEKTIADLIHEVKAL